MPTTYRREGHFPQPRSRRADATFLPNLKAMMASGRFRHFAATSAPPRLRLSRYFSRDYHARS